MTDHDLLIELNTKIDTISTNMTGVQEHVAVMNSEQGTQAIQIAKMEQNVDIAMWAMGIIAIAVIGQVVEMVFRWRNGKIK